MQFKKEDLDKRLCDILKNSTNTKTVREFIIDGYKEIFEHDIISSEEIDNLTEEDLNETIEEADWLLGK